MKNRTFAEDPTLTSYYEIANKIVVILRIRVEMDRINNDILELLAEQTAYVKLAGDLKSRTSKIADDQLITASGESPACYNRDFISILFLNSTIDGNNLKGTKIERFQRCQN